MTHSDLSQTFHFDLQPENQPRGKSHSIFTRNDVGSEYVPSYTNHTNFARNISSPIYFLYLYTFCGGNWKIKKEHLVWHNRIIFVSKSNDFSTFDESRAAEKNMEIRSIQNWSIFSMICFLFRSFSHFLLDIILFSPKFNVHALFLFVIYVILCFEYFLIPRNVSTMNSVLLAVVNLFS